jgi:hypothetical protein
MVSLREGGFGRAFSFNYLTYRSGDGRICAGYPSLNNHDIWRFGHDISSVKAEKAGRRKCTGIEPASSSPVHWF